MPCYTPLKAYRNDSPNPSGKRGLVFNPGRRASALEPIEVACGQCIGCRLERSRQWALRITHEASLHEENCFITLTFNDEHLPPDRSIRKRDWQLFLKRLRKHLHPRKIRFFACGEYGDQNDRPHYHAIIFGYDFPDKTLQTVSGAGHRIYTSSLLSDLWGFGFVTIGDVSFESAAYVARYVVKKVTGDAATEHYLRVDPDTGECFQLEPEFCLMSRRPGVGREWYEKYRSDLEKGFITARGVKMLPPKYYDRLLEQDDPFLFDHHKESRKLSALENSADNTDERLAVKQVIKERTLNRALKRNL